MAFVAVRRIDQTEEILGVTWRDFLSHPDKHRCRICCAGLLHCKGLGLRS
ncbi:hypothetical protein ACLB1M_20440 [Escherichia coli]